MSYWVLKGRRDRNAWDEILQPQARDLWRTAKPPSAWKISDRLFCWESTPARCIVGLAEISKTDAGVGNAGETLFEVQYVTRALGYKPSIDELRQIPLLNEASFLKSGPATTLLSLSYEQAELLLRFICAKNPNLDLPWADVDLNILGELIPDIDSGAAALEGKLKLAQHFIRERTPSIVETKKREVLRKAGHLVCEVCAFSFEHLYGARGLDFCEVHHIVPLSQCEAEIETRLEDLAILCSNCHRMVHRQPSIQIQELRRSLNREK